MRTTRTALHLLAGVALAAWAPEAAAESCMSPAKVPSLQVDKHEVCWSAIPGASGYDAVLGLSLAALGAAEPSLTEANLSCLGAQLTSTCVIVPFDPPVGDGFYFLVRANKGKDDGSYETGCAAEIPGRDEALVVAAACP